MGVSTILAESKVVKNFYYQGSGVSRRQWLRSAPCCCNSNREQTGTIRCFWLATGGIEVAMENGYHIYRCRDTIKVKQAVADIFQVYGHKLPLDRDTLVLVKPNCNSDMCALTGNTTDLRLVAAVVETLKQHGYHNIVIGDGPNIGLLSAGIDGLARLGIDRLASHYGVKYLDLNCAPYREIKIGKQTVRVAQVCFDANFFVNLPKIKTHAEAGFTCALKNLMGCVIGLDRHKVHLDLHRNLYLLNQHLRPHLHIVDGLIGMEGTGPSGGVPVRLDVLIAGEDAALVDWVAASLAGIDYRLVPHLRITLEEEVGLDVVASWKSIEPFKHFLRPSPSLLQRIITYPALRPWFVRIRYLPGISQLVSSELLSRLLYVLGARQENYIKADAKISRLAVNVDKCAVCKEQLCRAHCPLDTHPADTDGQCIACIYCYLACPSHAIQLEGELGYLGFQLERYGEGIRRALFDY